MNTERLEAIRERLIRAFDPTALEVIDESHLHVGHEGAKGGLGHFRVRIESVHFAGLKRIQAHRLVYNALGSMMQTDIHALSVDASAPDNA